MARRKEEKAVKTMPTVRIQWYRSTIGANSRHKVLVRSLGFTKLNQIVERPDTPSIRGMVAKAPYLLRFVD
jgi:large subunit ribosomal protein L30